jgi:hypothetical protein
MIPSAAYGPGSLSGGTAARTRNEVVAFKEVITMKHLTKHTAFLSTIILAMLTCLMLIACKPETGRSPVATPQLIAPQNSASTNPRATPLPVTPLPTATFLPDHGVRVGTVTEIMPGAKKQWGHLGYLMLEGQTLVAPMADSTGKQTPLAIDLNTQQVEMLDQNLSLDWKNDLYISRPYAVWLASQDNRSPLYAQDMRIGQTWSIADDANHIDLSGATVVWNQIGGKNLDIWGYDLAQQKRFSVVTDAGVHLGPLISKRWVAFLNLPPGDERNGFEAPLDVVNIDSSQVITVGSIWWNIYAYPLSLYAIDAPWVAWSSGPGNKTPDLHFYNLETRTGYTVTVPSCGEFLPNRPPVTGAPEYLALSDGTVIFKGCYQDMGYDIEHQVFFSLPTNAPYGFDKLGWSIAGDQLVWVLSSGPYGQEESHIYTAKIIRDK